MHTYRIVLAAARRGQATVQARPCDEGFENVLFRQRQARTVGRHHPGRMPRGSAKQLSMDATWLCPELWLRTWLWL